MVYPGNGKMRSVRMKSREIAEVKTNKLGNSNWQDRVKSEGFTNQAK
jgi:hypothetical protein